jgi:predicted ATPase
MFAVVIGGPNAGKSALLRELALDGYPVMKEVAEEVIKEGNHKPWLGDDAQLQFQEEVARRQWLYESALASNDELVLLDRGLLDAIAYRLIYGRRLTALHSSLTARHYQVAFLMDPVERWDNNGVRYEDPDFTREMTATSRWLYESVGVDVISVPFMDTLQQRVDYVHGFLSRFPQPKRRFMSMENVDLLQAA